MTSKPRDFIFLYGPPASGKTTLGRMLADALVQPFIDLDQWIETQAGLAIPDIFAEEGETGFRQRESAALDSLLDGPAAVVALGGGALIHIPNRARVEAAGLIVCLEAGFDTILSRLERADSGRPLLDGDTRTRLELLLEDRRRHYASFPLRLEVDRLVPDEVLWAALSLLGRFHITGMGAGYDAVVQPGGLDHLGLVLRRIGLRGPVALATDEHVAALHLERAVKSLEQAGYAVQPVILPPGEAYKTMETVGRLWDGFLKARLERGSTVVALGGGVVGDLAGFAASTFLRGVPWVAVPTTLLAMIDASLGGKTGADLPQGKNLVGAFHPPALVWADPDLLQTLPEAELRNGLAEVVKHGILGDPRLFALCRSGWSPVLENLDEIVRRAMTVKVRVIQEDPYERGRRAALNLGHTLGHALEAASDFRIRHGEAVAIGMVRAAQVSERRGLARPGLAQEIESVLAGLGLPTRIPPGLDPDRLQAAIGVDKKRSGGKVRLALPTEIGAVRVDGVLDDPEELFEEEQEAAR